MKRLSRADRWLGVASSVLILGLITGVMGLQSARVRSHIPYLNAPAPTATPAGVVITLDQLPAANVAAPVAAVSTEPAQAAVDIAPTLA
ncbi:MAG TPA: hypothetical protein VIC60_10735, partial [Thermomicrobiales bacterium]